MSTEAKAVEHTRSAEKETVASGEGRGEYTSIDKMWKASYSSTGNCNNEGRLGSGSAGLEEVRVVVSDEHANDQDTQEL